ncbi:MAG: DMT family transporter [Aquabacterium sp.]
MTAAAILSVATWRLPVLTALAMLAFAGNSLLTRAALQDTTIDAASFASIRLGAGALALGLILRVRRAGGAGPAAARRDRLATARRDLLAAAMLFAYCAAFSFAYRWLDAGTGALVLFGSVQVTMFVVGLRAGEHWPPLAWCGASLAVAGLAALVWPGVGAPHVGGAVLMGLAGLAWGVYSLRGRGVAQPLAATASNFVWSLPLAIGLSLLTLDQARWDPPGALLALVSGAITSGLGYALWYAALPALGALRGAVVQLSVPAIAALGGLLWLGEQPGLRLLGASVAILGGIGLALWARGRPATSSPSSTTSSR